MRLLPTLRGRLLLVGALAIVPLGAAFVLAHRELRGWSEAEWREDAVAVAMTAADAHADVLEETKAVLTALSHLSSLNSPGTADCERIFGEFYRSRGYFTALGLVGLDGNTHCMVPGGRLYIGDRPYFREAVETKRFALSDYHIGYISGRSVVTMAMPILSADSAVVAVVAAGLDLGRLRPLPGELELSPGAHLTLFDRTGHVLYHAPDEPPVPGDLVPDALLAAARQTPGSRIVEVPGPGGDARTTAVSRVEVEGGEPGAFVSVSFGPGWISNEVAAISRPALLGLGVAFLVLLGGLAAAIELLVLRRITPIVAASERLGQGDLAARSGVRSGDDEIARLGRTFDEMADNLQALRKVEVEWARQRVAESEERLRLLAETIDEVFWIWDPREQRYVYLSPAFETIWGIPPEPLMADPHVWTESMHPDDREAMRARMVDAGTLREGEHEYRILRPDGEERWIASRTFAVRGEDGEVERYLGVAQDITERKLLEDALLHATKLEAVGRLAGGVAHDFNNVLTAIQGHAQFMMEELPADNSVRADLDEIAIGVQRAAALTRQLLTFSRKQAVQPRVLDLNRIVGSTAGMLRRLIGEDVDLVLRLAEDLPPVRGDLHQMEQVLLNLSVNARDAMPCGGTLVIETRPWKVERTEALTSDVIRPGDYVRLRVTDTGTGMSPDILEHVFEPFFTTKPPGQGTGLGLATVYGIVKQVGGAIHVESVEGEGTSFFIHLPPAPDEAAEPEPTGRRPAPATEGHRVLLAEDEDGVRQVVERMLTRLGYRVTTASSGPEALAAVDGGLEVDLLFSDVVMPGMNGVELHRRLTERLPDLPAVFMSGYPGFGLQDGAIPGSQVFLQKPFTRDELGEALSRAMERTGREA